jgi:heparosan-N-sulfate-glucuronate 5-epimerase
VLHDNSRNIGVQYNPVTITSYALGVYQLYLQTKDRSLLKKFLKTADWLVENQSVSNNIGVWHYNFSWKGLKEPWISGMAQGEALSVLTRAYRRTKSVKYLKSASFAFNSFKNSIENGGVVSNLDNGMKFYEEYVSNSPSHVLNGFLYSLWGIYEYYYTFNDASAKNVFDEGLVSLEYILPKFDTGFWSKYCLSNRKVINIASYMYHELHIVQLESINQITKSPSHLRGKQFIP